MLRWLVALLLVANLGFYAWSHGWLKPLGGASSEGEREPERLKRQVRPDAVRLLTPRSSSSSAAANCLQAGPYADTELAAAEAALRAAGIPSGRWQQMAMERPGVWLVYMGRFPDRDVLQRKEAELQRLRQPYEEVHGVPELEPGLALGRFGDRATANTALSQITQRGVRSVRVVALTPPRQVFVLRVDRPDPALQNQLAGLKVPALRGGFTPCAASG